MRREICLFTVCLFFFFLQLGYKVSKVTEQLYRVIRFSVQRNAAKLDFGFSGQTHGF